MQETFAYRPTTNAQIQRKGGDVEFRRADGPERYSLALSLLIILAASAGLWGLLFLALFSL